jgi:serine protease Do
MESAIWAANWSATFSCASALAARQAGLQPGDVVLSVGRTDVSSPAELDRELVKAKAGETVMLLVRDATGGTQYRAVTPRVGGDQ